MGAEKSVLIASSSLDNATCRPVVENLASRGYDVTLYEADKVAAGIVSLEVSFDPDLGLTGRYGGAPFNLPAFDAAWYRRPTSFEEIDERAPDKLRAIGMRTQRSMTQYGLWGFVPRCAWLNGPEENDRAEDKLSQLAVAQSVGLAVPHTLVTNSHDAIQSRLPERVIHKPAYPYIYSEQGTLVCYTNRYDNTHAGLPTGNPFPGFWQPFIDKAREWRITIVGDNSFDAVIYTDPEAKVDWRRHQTSPSVRFEHGTFPDDVKERCFRYLGAYGIKFGCFDFIEKPDGQQIFLECNPNGQYGWLEDELGFQVTQAISDELASIASHS